MRFLFIFKRFIIKIIGSHYFKSLSLLKYAFIIPHIFFLIFKSKVYFNFILL